MAEFKLNKNAEGYSDPTAFNAVTKVLRDEADQLRRVSTVIGLIKSIVDLAGFDLIARIEIRDRKTGREYR
jgi:hypothetical protein